MQASYKLLLLGHSTRVVAMCLATTETDSISKTDDVLISASEDGWETSLCEQKLKYMRYWLFDIQSIVRSYAGMQPTVDASPRTRKDSLVFHIASMFAVTWQVYEIPKQNVSQYRVIAMMVNIFLSAGWASQICVLLRIRKRDYYHGCKHAKGKSNLSVYATCWQMFSLTKDAWTK
jgi:hypothetical protein